jgi:hypothetical protein
MKNKVYRNPEKESGGVTQQHEDERSGDRGITLSLPKEIVEIKQRSRKSRRHKEAT